MVMKNTTLSMNLTDLPLRPTIQSLLQKSGFVTLGEIEESRINGGMTNLAAELGVTMVEAAGLIREIQGCLSVFAGNGSGNGTVQTSTDSGENGDGVVDVAAVVSNDDFAIPTAGDIMNARKDQNTFIITFCRSVDLMLGGGIALGEVTEMAGMPGVGKTQLAMQLAVNTRLPRACGGVQGRTIYIDAEGSFSPHRCMSMANALVQHVKRTALRKQQQGHRHAAVPQNFTTEAILDGISVYRVHDEAAQTATIYNLKKLLEDAADHDVPIRLVVIDSITFHYRCAHPNRDYIQRTKALASIAALLSDLATKYSVAVVVVNHMTTRLGAAGSWVVPALGESWAHAMTTRLILSRNEMSTSRQCALVKSPHRALAKAEYVVREIGVRGVPCDNKASSSSSIRGTDVSQMNKRPRVN